MKNFRGDLSTILLCVIMIIGFGVLSFQIQNIKPPQIETPLTDNELKFQACATALAGEGVIIKMEDSTRDAKAGENPNLYVIHDDDILRVINELRAAGAEAISINEQRLTATSEIRCAGATLSVNNVRSAAPFVIKAIGDKNSLSNAITMRGGVNDTLKVWGIQLEISTADNVYIPPYKGNFKPTYSRIVD